MFAANLERSSLSIFFLWLHLPTLTLTDMVCENVNHILNNNPRDTNAIWAMGQSLSLYSDLIPHLPAVKA